jgi:DNA-binding NtrC family response regulator
LQSALTVLVVEKNVDLSRNLCQVLGPAYPNTITANDSAAALQTLRSQPIDVLVADVSDQNTGGMDLLREAVAQHRHMMAVAVLEAGDTERALEALRLGVYQCLSRPLDTRSLVAAVDGAAKEILKRHVSLQTRQRLALGYGGKRLIGNSLAMREVLDKIELVRHVNCSVVIRGETGTGKELVAYAIHNSSPRARSPFVKLNCGAIPRDLLESELFGHEKGSFTGALQQHIGRFEMAHRGTILLDEIGDMPLELQVKLLGVLQDRTVQRVGGQERIPVDVRVVAATHQDLEKAIKQNRFREDLYYRLNVITIGVPPLRERKEDIPLLIQHFLDRFRRETGKDIEGVDSEAVQLLMGYDYPGNVRELENIIEGAVVFCQNHMITAAELPSTVGNGTETPVGQVKIAVGTPLDEVERLCIIETLKHTEGNKRRAAGLLGISERSIHNKLERYHLTTASFRTRNEAQPVPPDPPKRSGGE